MGEVLSKAGVLICISVLGYALKKLHVLQAEDYRPLSKIIMNVTLPCAVITAFAEGYRAEPLLFIAVLFGFLGNVIMMWVGWLLSRNKRKEEKAFYMLNASGYNIGAFVMPFVQSFLSPFSMVAACMFDVGNAVMCTGGTYAFLSSTLLREGEKKGRMASFCKKLFSSVTFDAYLILLLLASFGLRLPGPILEITGKIGDSNGFVAMLAVGVMFEFPKELSRLGKAFTIVIVRMLGAALFALFFYFCLPLPLEIRQAMCIVCFAPVSVVAMIYSEKITGDGALASLTGSLSILLCLPVILGLVLML